MFTAVSHAHAGVYKSVIANKVGKATCYAHLYVTGKQQWAPPAMWWWHHLAATLPGCVLKLVSGSMVRCWSDKIAVQLKLEEISGSF